MVLVLRGTPHSTTSRCPGEEKKSQERVGRERGGGEGPSAESQRSNCNFDKQQIKGVSPWSLIS